MPRHEGCGKNVKRRSLGEPSTPLRASSSGTVPLGTGGVTQRIASMAGSSSRAPSTPPSEGAVASARVPFEYSPLGNGRPSASAPRAQRVGAYLQACAWQSLQRGSSSLSATAPPCSP